MVCVFSLGRTSPLQNRLDPPAHAAAHFSSSALWHPTFQQISTDICPHWFLLILYRVLVYMMATFNLTTTFTPPSECLTDVYRYNDNQLLGPMTSICYPVGWTNTSTTFYSPGICPSGYTTACISANTANTVTETIATCCPT